MEFRAIVKGRPVDLKGTLFYVSGILTICLLDLSVLAGVVWIMRRYPILQMIAWSVLIFLILIGAGVGLLFRWGGRDNSE